MMINEDDRRTLCEALEKLDQAISDTQVDQIGHYLEELLKWNNTYNLTGFKSFQDNLIYNVLDCLSVGPFINASRVIDVGTGAGLPGVLLSIVRPEQVWTLLDANGKKTRFLQHIRQKLGLNIEIIHARMEQYQPVERYEQMCSRALDKIPETLEIGQHLLASKSHFFAMKGKLQEEDLQKLPVWASVENIIRIEVPMLKAERHLIQIAVNKTKEE